MRIKGAWGNDQSSERSGVAEGIPVTSLEDLPPAGLAAPSPHRLPLWTSLKRVPHHPLSPGDVSFLTRKVPFIKSCHRLVLIPQQTSAKKRIPNVILYPVRAHISPWICYLLLLLGLVFHFESWANCIQCTWLNVYYITICLLFSLELRVLRNWIGTGKMAQSVKREVKRWIPRTYVKARRIRWHSSVLGR